LEAKVRGEAGSAEKAEADREVSEKAKWNRGPDQKAVNAQISSNHTMNSHCQKGHRKMVA